MVVASLKQGTLNIQTQGLLKLTGGTNNEVDSLTITSGYLDLTDSSLLIDYSGGPDPIASIAAWIKSGYANGSWNGIGIMSSAAQNNPGYGIGYADSADPGNPANLPSDTIEIMYTLLGDANLDGTVNSEDFTPFRATWAKAAWRGIKGTSITMERSTPKISRRSRTISASPPTGRAICSRRTASASRMCPNPPARG